MNRLIIIGNGFDLAHGLKTSYEDFIDWYWDQRISSFSFCHSRINQDPLCTLEIVMDDKDFDWYLFAYNNSHFNVLSELDKTTGRREFVKLLGKDVIAELRKHPESYSFKETEFFHNICQSIKTKGWVDIENEYYRLLKANSQSPESCTFTVDDLNKQLLFLQNKLIDYLKSISINENLYKKNIEKIIYSPIKPKDVAIKSKKEFADYVNNLVQDESLDFIREKLTQYDLRNQILSKDIKNLRDSIDYEGVGSVLESLENGIYSPILLPDNILILSFNYTRTAELYLKNSDSFSIDYIHGKLEDKNSVIFGYGDELDEEYKQMQNKNENKYLKNIKSIRYLESDNYRKVLSFIESSPYQVYIMGHSCGNSDRTLLNTLFEHRNCISIKPYYYIKDDGTDNYLELAQNISRNFTDMKLMRDRVVNKTYCDTL